MGVGERGRGREREGERERGEEGRERCNGQTQGLRTTMPRTREGWLVRVSNVLPGSAVRRYGVLEHGQVKYYRTKDERELAPEQPAKQYPLTIGCHVSQVNQGSCLTRHLQSAATTMVKSITRLYERQTLYSFHVTWPHTLHIEQLKLGFESEIEANRWKEDIESVVKMLEGAAPELEQSLSGSQNNDENQLLSAAEEVDGNFSQYLEDSGKWKLKKVLHGVRVFEGAQANEDGLKANMVSVIIRGVPPTKILKTIMDQNTMTDICGMFHARVLDEEGERVTVFGNMYPKTRLPVWPRQFLSQRSWRQEEDGTFFVLVNQIVPQAPHHIFAVEECKKEGFFKRPVTSTNTVASFTISPLKSKHAEDNPGMLEVLLTYTVQLDPGGWLSYRKNDNWLVARLKSAARYVVDIERVIIDPLLIGAIAIRDLCEQGRFIATPLEGNRFNLNPNARPNMILGSVRARARSMNVAVKAAAFAAIKWKRYKRLTQARASSIVRARICTQISQEQWSCPGSADFKVRGKTYLDDKKKILAGDPLFDLFSADLILFKEPQEHVAKIAKHLICITSFTVIVQLMVPGPPHYSLIFSFIPHDDSCYKDTSKPFGRLFQKMLESDDTDRNAMLKLIPRVAQGPWVVRQAVGTTPVLLGQKLKTTYHLSDNYLEMDCDIASSSVAASIVKLVSGYTRSIAVELGVVLQGATDDELPEELLGTIRLDRLNLSAAVPWQD